jgi:hypothetical protein
VAEQVVDDTAEETGIMSASIVGFPDFQTLYYEIFSRVQPVDCLQLSPHELQQTDYDLLKSDGDESNMLPDKKDKKKRRELVPVTELWKKADADFDTSNGLRMPRNDRQSGIVAIQEHHENLENSQLSELKEPSPQPAMVIRKS